MLQSSDPDYKFIQLKKKKKVSNCKKNKISTFSKGKSILTNIYNFMKILALVLICILRLSLSLMWIICLNTC